MGILYLVATPIGNLEDISPRAVRILGEVHLIAAEDTRVTRKLLSHFDLHTEMTSYFEHNKLLKLENILDVLKTGDVALVSDAGTPGINDPGYDLVQTVLDSGYEVCPIPGPSAPLTALTASGLPTGAFIYLGYLPRKQGMRKEFLQEVENLPYTMIFLETPHRLLAALADMESVFGGRKMAAARELTKVHEEIWRGTVPGAIDYFSRNKPRGEFTLVVEGKLKNERLQWTHDKVLSALKSGLKSGESPSALAKRVATESGWERKAIYDVIIGLKR